MIYTALSLAALAVNQVAEAKTYFLENFDDAEWTSRWTVPDKWKPKHELGAWKHADDVWISSADKAIETSEEARFYGLSANMDEPFTNQDKELVLQMSVQLRNGVGCAGSYIKLLSKVDPSEFGGDTPYQIMFGPDICGTSNRRTHVIFSHPDHEESLLIEKDIRVETDTLPHLYTLIVKPDNTFEVLIDQEVVRDGKLEEHWAFLPPKEMKQPGVSKPVDWVDEPMMDDPSDVKPEGWDDIPAQVPDPEAVQPDGWDAEEDGEWEAPLVPNPDYQGEWKAKRIPNPDYKGQWEHPMVPNPDYLEDANLYVRCTECASVGFELWQMTPGTVFDDIMVTDSSQEAFDYAEKVWKPKADAAREEEEARRQAMMEAQREMMEEQEEEVPSVFGDEFEGQFEEEFEAVAEDLEARGNADAGFEEFNTFDDEL